jgi:bifunctional non-homologous end joining protein LigD
VRASSLHLPGVGGWRQQILQPVLQGRGRHDGDFLQLRARRLRGHRSRPEHDREIVNAPASTARRQLSRGGGPGAGRMAREVGVSRPDKLFWPEEGYTKLALARFYDSVYARLKSYVTDRLLTLERCPDGMRGECFYQKQKPRGLPAGTPTRAITHQNRTVHYVVGGSRTTQAALVNLGCIAVHIWGSRAGHPRRPDWMVFDLDPDSGDFADSARAGVLLKRDLDALGLASFPKTSGGRGLHVFIPLRVGPDANDVLCFARALCERLAAAHPAELTVEPHVAKRRGRVYLDPFRNGFAQTVVAPYSVRRRAKAPVSTPLSWPEVNPELDPTRFNMGNFERRLAAPDPWADFFRSRQSLPRGGRAMP